LGSKTKKSIAAMEKEQERKAEEEKSKEKKAGKAGKPSRYATGQFSLTVREEEAIQALAPLKAITLYGTAKALGVKASVASGLLRSMYEKGILERVGGRSGRYIYSVRKK